MLLRPVFATTSTARRLLVDSMNFSVADQLIEALSERASRSRIWSWPRVAPIVALSGAQFAQALQTFEGSDPSVRDSRSRKRELLQPGQCLQRGHSLVRYFGIGQRETPKADELSDLNQASIINGRLK